MTGVLLDPDGQHLLYAARQGKTWRVMEDHEVLAECRSARAWGYRAGNAEPAAVCEPLDGAPERFVVVGRGGVLWGPHSEQPRGLRWAKLPDGSDTYAVHAGGQVWIDDVPVFTGVLGEGAEIQYGLFSTDGGRFAALIEHGDHAQLAIWDRATGSSSVWTSTHPRRPRDVLLGAGWGSFSADGERFGYAYGGRIIIDDVMTEGASVHGFLDDGRAVIEVGWTDPVLLAGDTQVAETGDSRKGVFLEVAVEGDKVYWVSRETGNLVAGCAAP